MKYTVELDQKRARGCSLSRAFPWVIRDEAGDVLQFAKTQEGALKWIERQTTSKTA